ncbi:MAG: MoaD/ThiS family protein [Thermodesulfovibrionales bacterium]
MSVKVRIPTPLQRLTQGNEEVEGKAGTIIDLVLALDKDYPGIAERISENGKIRRFVNIYLNEEDIRFLSGEATPVKDGDEVSIIPAIAGGSRRRQYEEAG